jgi:hypothetical protein
MTQDVCFPKFEHAPAVADIAQVCHPRWARVRNPRSPTPTVSPIPAARAELTPASASSNTTPRAGAILSRSAPMRYGSGAGFPWPTSCAVTMSSGQGSPAALSRARATARTADVTTVQLSCGSRLSNSTAPGRACTIGAVSNSSCIKARLARSRSCAGTNSATVSPAGRPWVMSRTKSKSGAYSAAQLFQACAAASSESTSTPSQSKSKPSADITVFL